MEGGASYLVKFDTETDKDNYEIETVEGPDIGAAKIAEKRVYMIEEKLVKRG